MSESTEENAKPDFDPTLLARMIGELGDGATLARLSTDLATVYSEFLPDMFHSETGYDIEVTFEECRTGLKETLLSDLGSAVALNDGGLRGWCSDFTLGCDSTFIMTLVEAMLGAAPETIEPPAPRPLSKIELDLSEMVFSKIANVLRSAVAGGGSYEPVLGKPYNAANRPSPPEGYKESNVALVVLGISLGKTEARFYIAIPQRNFLKTRISTPKSTGAGKTKKEWTDQIKEQVQRSQVGVEARIKLQSLTLNRLSRLQVGDVIPFLEGDDVRVEVNANGKELYFGEFGRSGEKYTVRVTDTYTTETDILTHLMG